MKIGVTIWNFTPGTGGLYKHAEDLVLELKKLGHDVVVVTRSSTFVPRNSDFMLRNEVARTATRLGIEIRHLVYPPGLGWLRWLIMQLLHRGLCQPIALSLYWFQARRAALECLKDREIVHHVGQSCALVGYAAANAAKYLALPFVVQPTVHPGQAGDSPLDIRLFTMADGLLVHTEFEKSFFAEKVGHTSITVVGNGIQDRSDGDASRFRATIGISGPFVLYIGRKDANKGYDLVVQAWRVAREKVVSLDLVCIGPAGSSTRHPSENGFHELEFCNEDTKHDALAACDCLCVPSEGESFGLIFMEAGRYGKSVIARRLPVLMELLGDRAAILVGSESSYNRVAATPEEVATGIVNIVTNPSLNAELGSRLLAISSQHIWSRTVLKFENAYRLYLPAQPKNRLIS